MNEATFTTKFVKWMKNKFPVTCAWEVKITKGKSIPFSDLAPHQKDALLKASEQQLTWKIPDTGYQNPCDGFTLYKVPAYVVVYFYHRGNKEFFMISIKRWCMLERSLGRKSITREDADIAGTRYELG